MARASSYQHKDILAFVAEAVFINKRSALDTLSDSVTIFSSSIGAYYANMGILPERYLVSILPDHITKECLMQLHSLVM